MKKIRLSRPLHAAVCILLILLVLIFLRLAYGPFPVYGEKTVVRRMERRVLRSHGEQIARWDDMNEQTFAVWDGEDILMYYTAWDNKAVFYGTNRVPIPKPLIRRYRIGHLFRDSRYVGGWGCAGYIVKVKQGEDWVASLPILVKNTDPTACRGRLTVTLESWSETQQTYLHTYIWKAEAERNDPRVFIFTLISSESKESRLHYLASMNGPNGLRALGEIVWYDENGGETGRQSIKLLEDEKRERSDKDGA